MEQRFGDRDEGSPVKNWRRLQLTEMKGEYFSKVFTPEGVEMAKEV